MSGEPYGGRIIGYPRVHTMEFISILDCANESYARELGLKSIQAVATHKSWMGGREGFTSYNAFCIIPAFVCWIPDHTIGKYCPRREFLAFWLEHYG